MRAAFRPEWCLVAEEHDRLVGFIWAKAALWGEERASRAHLCAIITHPDNINQGIGTTLWNELMQRLRKAGVRRVRLGGAAHQLLPGIPHSVSLATWRFLRAKGVVFQGLEHDVHADLTQLPALRLPENYRVLPVTQDDSHADDAVDFVAKAFAGRWHDEVKERLAAGETVLVLEHTPNNTNNKNIVGFAYVTFDSDYPAPGLNWRAALPADRRVSGLGPIGIDAEMRGQGLGLTFLHACCQYLQTQGATDVLIDWTDLVAFYGRIGAHVWRTYQSGYMVLE
jgi:ribosomal protein S18 acetylase RimI-like enzyme